MAGVHSSRPSAPGDAATDHTWHEVLHRLAARADARRAGESEAARLERKLAQIVAAVESRRPSWHAEAACRGSSIDFTSDHPLARRRALEVCGRCAVLRECASWADAIGDRASVLGGEDGPSRRARWRREAAGRTTTKENP